MLCVWYGVIVFWQRIVEGVAKRLTGGACTKAFTDEYISHKRDMQMLSLFLETKSIPREWIWYQRTYLTDGRFWKKIKYWTWNCHHRRYISGRFNFSWLQSRSLSLQRVIRLPWSIFHMISNLRLRVRTYRVRSTSNSAKLLQNRFSNTPTSFNSFLVTCTRIWKFLSCFETAHTLGSCTLLSGTP